MKKISTLFFIALSIITSAFAAEGESLPPKLEHDDYANSHSFCGTVFSIEIVEHDPSHENAVYQVNLGNYITPAENGGYLLKSWKLEVGDELIVRVDSHDAPVEKMIEEHSGGDNKYTADELHQKFRFDNRQFSWWSSSPSDRCTRYHYTVFIDGYVYTDLFDSLFSNNGSDIFKIVEKSRVNPAYVHYKATGKGHVECFYELRFYYNEGSGYL